MSKETIEALLVIAKFLLSMAGGGGMSRRSQGELEEWARSLEDKLHCVDEERV
jgi:hypothetical protein